MIDFLKKLVLAIIQGIAEILPISSSGHLLIASELLNVNTNGLQFLIFLHLGSLIAMIIPVFRRNTRKLPSNFVINFS